MVIKCSVFPEDESRLTPTEYAVALLARGCSPDEVRERMRQERIVFPSISGVLIEMMEKRGKSVEVVAGLADVEPTTIYRIIKKERNPSRNILFRLALAMELTFAETQVLLKSGNCASLSASRPRDLVIMDGIIHNRDFVEVNVELEKKGFPNLNGRG